ncbi:MAG: hypothetical protein M3Y70_08390, partial [Pseudomonadota bacterium]|nr:hypothetical protein [Pseudomonadota bacterium]
MQALQRFAAILLADLRERTRTPRFWVMLGLVVAATWWCFPPAEAGYRVLSVRGGDRGYYSSAWIGMTLAMVYGSLLTLGGFYAVRGNLARDIDTRVWQLLVATPMTRGTYLLAKWASHMVVLGAILVAGLSVALVAQWVRAEDRHVDLFELAKPVLVLGVPGLAMMAMLAIWFDLVPWLRRTAGNVVFFIAWVAASSIGMAQFEAADTTAARTGWRSDPVGMVVVARDFQRVRTAQTGQTQEFGYNIGVQVQREPGGLFEWKRWSPRPMDLLGRALWLLAALAGVLAAAPFLDRAAARTSTSTRKRSGAGSRLRWLDRLLDPFARGPRSTLVVAELKVALRQRPAWWWFAAVALAVVQAFAPIKGAAIAIVLAWVLPLDILARAILREHSHGTGGLVLVSPGAIPRLLGARFMVAVVLLAALSWPGILRLSLAAPAAALAAFAVIVSIASWGLCLGALARSPRPFELVLVAAVYAGVQGAGLFDLVHAPLATAAWHAAMLLPAWALLAWSWPRLARSTAMAA